MGAPERRRPARALALLAALALGGCAALAPHFERPRLAVVGVEVSDFSLAEQHFRVRLRVQNPNDRALPVRGIDYTLRLEGDDFGHGASVSAFSVPPRGEADFEVLMTTNLAASLWKVLPRLKEGAPVGYQLAGTVTTDLVFLHSVPFDEHGSFRLH